MENPHSPSKLLSHHTVSLGCDAHRLTQSPLTSDAMAAKHGNSKSAWATSSPFNSMMQSKPRLLCIFYSWFIWTSQISFGKMLKAYFLILPLFLCSISPGPESRGEAICIHWRGRSLLTGGDLWQMCRADPKGLDLLFSSANLKNKIIMGRRTDRQRLAWMPARGLLEHV